MTWVKQQDDPTGGAVLRALTAAIEPFTQQAAESTPEAPTRVSVIVTAGTPMTVEVLHYDAADQARTYRSVGFGEVGDALATAAGDVIARGLNHQPLDVRKKVAEALENDGQLTLEVDPVFGSATGSLVVQGRKPVHVFALQAGDVH